MIGQPERLRGAGDVPLVPLERVITIRRSASAFSSRNVSPPAAGGAASPRISGGTWSGPMTSPSVAMIIRSITLRRSRTLFRAQS
jgi:hypothetical protein